MPLSTSEAINLIEREHPEWAEHCVRWRWQLDSLEGGERYRQAVYGSDYRGLPVRNLIRHKREYPDPITCDSTDAIYGPGNASTQFAGGINRVSSDQSQYALNDDYELRRARTPVPTFVAEAVDMYCSKIFGSEIDRDTPQGPMYAGLLNWWTDVDGRGTTIDDWMAETIAPLLVTLGQLDLVFDHPAPPIGVAIESEADVTRENLKRCVASYVLPENMTWWRLDEKGCYCECVYREYSEDGDGSTIGEGPRPLLIGSQCIQYRHWTTTESNLYGSDGTLISTTSHNFGCVPIVRVFDQRKPRCRNIGQSRMDAVAELQREYYNRDSELILSDTTQAHPLLQGPEDYVQADGTVPVGPGWLLPKKKNSNGGAASYEGFSVVEFPKGGADSIRQNKADLRDSVDRATSLMKPAGAAGTGGNTIGQSGVSKAFDYDGLHSKLSKLARALGRVEMQVVRYVLTVLNDGTLIEGITDKVKISYPTVFNLYAADELAKILGDFQAVLSASGDTPETETAVLCEIVRKALPGRDDPTYRTYDDEIKSSIFKKSTAKDQASEGISSAGNSQPALITTTIGEIEDDPETVESESD